MHTNWLSYTAKNPKGEPWLIIIKTKTNKKNYHSRAHCCISKLLCGGPTTHAQIDPFITHLCGEPTTHAQIDPFITHLCGGPTTHAQIVHLKTSVWWTYHSRTLLNAAYCENTEYKTRAIAHFTVAGENEAGVDLVLIQPFLLYYVYHVFLMLTSIFKQNLH